MSAKNCPAAGALIRPYRAPFSQGEKGKDIIWGHPGIFAGWEAPPRPNRAAAMARKSRSLSGFMPTPTSRTIPRKASGFNKDDAKKNLVIVAPAFGVKRSAKFAPTDATRASQADHLAWLRAINFYPAKPFTSADILSHAFSGLLFWMPSKKRD